jgi:hypothetical protein
MEYLSKYVLSCSQTGIYTSQHILTSELVAEILLRSLQYPPESDLEASKTSLNSRWQLWRAYKFNNMQYAPSCRQFCTKAISLNPILIIQGVQHWAPSNLSYKTLGMILSFISCIGLWNIDWHGGKSTIIHCRLPWLLE